MPSGRPCRSLGAGSVRYAERRASASASVDTIVDTMNDDGMGARAAERSVALELWEPAVDDVALPAERAAVQGDRGHRVEAVIGALALEEVD